MHFVSQRTGCDVGGENETNVKAATVTNYPIRDNDNGQLVKAPKVKVKRYKTNRVTPVPIVDSDFVDIVKPSAIDRLPVELIQEIIQHVDNDPYTILNLLLVSKIWRITLIV